MVHRIRTEEEIAAKAKEFEYFPPPKYKIGDEVYLIEPPIKWGLPMDYDTDTKLVIVKDPFRTSEARYIGYTATIEYLGYEYQIYQSSLSSTKRKKNKPVRGKV